MKNVQIIDDAENCSYSVYSIPNEDFALLFPNGQDVEFVEDAIDRLGEGKVGRIMRSTWNSRQKKNQLSGIHGTLFIGKGHLHRRKLYPNKKETDLDENQSR